MNARVSAKMTKWSSWGSRRYPSTSARRTRRITTEVRPLFYDHSRARGTIDRWSGQRFLSTPADLREYTKCAATVWLVRAVSPVRRPFEVNEVWKDRLVTATEVFRSADDRLAVIRADLRVDRVC